MRVKTKKEIAETLDRRNRNRGLTFDSEMLRYCGGEFRVLRRVSRMINEGTGELFELPGECIVLDTVTCTAEYHRLCRRSHFPYWREIWLTRVTRTCRNHQLGAIAGAVGRPGRTGQFCSIGSMHVHDLAMPELEGEQLPDLFGIIGHPAAVLVDHAADC